MTLDNNINKSTDKHTPDGHSPSSPLTLGSQWQQVKNRSHLNGAFLVHRWDLSLSLLFFLSFIAIFCIAVSVTANESGSACARLLLQARWDSVEMTFGGWPTRWNHNVAIRGAFYHPIDSCDRVTHKHAGAQKCTQSQIKHWIHASDIMADNTHALC